jgi:hypothetical protein
MSELLDLMVITIHQQRKEIEGLKHDSETLKK